MASRAPLEIAGQRIRLGESCELQLPYGESYLGRPLSVPLFVMRARRDGPRLFVTGVIHGDELNGLGVVRDLLFDQPPELTKGSLILIPVVNIDGLDAHSRYMPDRRDPNRCFPGSPTGSQTSRWAHAIFSDVVRQCDYGIDFHSAAVRRTNYPNVRANLRDPKTKKLAIAFGSELIVNGKGPKGSLRRTAQESGVPTIILEAGEVWKIEPRVVEIGVRGILNVLKSLGMMSGKPEPPSFQVTVERTVWLRAEQGGILGFHAAPGQLVSKMECLATVFNIFGREQTALLSPVNGVVLGMTSMPAVKPGGPVYHIALLPDRTFARLSKALGRSEGEGVPAHIQSGYSTVLTMRDRHSAGFATKQE